MKFNNVDKNRQLLLENISSVIAVGFSFGLTAGNGNRCSKELTEQKFCTNTILRYFVVCPYDGLWKNL